jgi:hypothetical protein
LCAGGEEITPVAGSSTRTANQRYDLGGGVQAVRANDDTVTFTTPDAQDAVNE